LYLRRLLFLTLAHSYAPGRAPSAGLLHALGMRIFYPLLVLVCFSACSHAPPESNVGRESNAAIAALGRPDASARLADTLLQLDKLDERLKVTRARRDNAQGQAANDVRKQSAVDGAEAELSAIQQQRSTLLHEQHVLEARIRELDN
jgi:hypothetical protein